jgi:Holliday junction resolvase RusA-like endonuclease
MNNTDVNSPEDLGSRFWVQKGDELIFDSGDGGLRRKEVAFIIHGNPVPMQRPRTNFIHHSIYSPSYIHMKIFKHLIISKISPPQSRVPRKSITPLFNNRDEKVQVDITFQMRRPLNHFVGNKRNNHLKDRYVDTGPSFTTVGGDLDNLGKFIFDALEGTIYQNDSQVTKATMQKVWDDEGECKGATVVHIVGLDI